MTKRVDYVDFHLPVDDCDIGFRTFVPGWAETPSTTGGIWSWLKLRISNSPTVINLMIICTPENGMRLERY